MNLKVAQRAAPKILIALLILVILFQVGIIVKIIPYEIVGGGRLENDAQMYRLAGISILLNGGLIGVLLLQENFFQHRVPQKVLRGLLWFFLFIFLLNTLGNLLAKTVFEQSFAFLTLLFVALLALILKK